MPDMRLGNAGSARLCQARRLEEADKLSFKLLCPQSWSEFQVGPRGPTPDLCALDMAAPLKTSWFMSVQTQSCHACFCGVL